MVKKGRDKGMTEGLRHLTQHQMLKDDLVKVREIELFLISHRRIWNLQEWELIRMKWFKLEEDYSKALNVKRKLVVNIKRSLKMLKDDLIKTLMLNFPNMTLILTTPKSIQKFYGDLVQFILDMLKRDIKKYVEELGLDKDNKF